MEALERMRIAGISLNGILHIGANDGQERYEYQATKTNPVIYIEPIDAVFDRLKTHIADMEGHVAIKALCTETSGHFIRLNIASNDGQSSSIFGLGHHAELFPNIAYTAHQDIISTTVDDLVGSLPKIPNLLVIDTQGADLKVLEGAKDALKYHFDAVFVEVSEEPLYEGSCTQDEITALLSQFGFRLRWVSIHGMGHGDAFYCKAPGSRSYEVEKDLTVIEALALLTPYDIDKEKQRLGPPTDGGYIMIPALFDPSQHVFSYGINGEYRFDVEMAARGHKIMMFDHTIDGIHNPTSDPKLCWVKEGVDGTSNPAENLDTIENQLSKYGEDQHDIIMKMDVEGYEYDSFDALPVEQMKRFQQIIFEIHNLHSIHIPEFRKKFVRVLTKLNSAFTLFHVHANNFDGEATYSFFSGIPVSNLLELSYVRSDLVVRRQSSTLYPTPLDYPNVHPQDKKLWFFPFLPTSAIIADFVDADKRMAEFAKKYDA